MIPAIHQTTSQFRNTLQLELISILCRLNQPVPVFDQPLPSATSTPSLPNILAAQSDPAKSLLRCCKEGWQSAWLNEQGESLHTSLFLTRPHEARENYRKTQNVQLRVVRDFYRTPRQ